MKRIIVILAIVMLVFGLFCGCSKKKQTSGPAAPSQPKQTQMADANSKADTNNPMLDRAVQKTTESQSGERRPREE